VTSGASVESSVLQDRSIANTREPQGVLRQVWAILSPADRRQLYFLAPAMVLTAFLETAGVASIVPFMALLSEPGAIDRQPILAWAYEWFRFTTRESFFFVIGLAVLGLITVGNVVSAATTWALLRFSWMGNHTLSLRLLESYLARPYAYFLGQNTSGLISNLFNEVQSVVSGILVTMLQLAARSVVMIGVLGALLWLDPLMAVGVGVVFGGLYGSIFLVVRRRLRTSGQERQRANKARHKVGVEALTGIKELKLYGLEYIVAQAYSVPSKRFASLQATTSVIGSIPRFALETIAFGGVLVIVLGLLARGQPLSGALPMLGLYAFAAYRMLPGLQIVFSGMTQIRFSMAALDLLHRDLERERPAQRPPPPVSPVAFVDKLEVRDVRFRYSDAQSDVSRGVTLSIRPGEWLALVGPTGSGKSTLVDLILGLLTPTSGEILVDGEVLDESRCRSWQRNVAYVPQQIFLLDDTVLRNIAFGVPEHEIDRQRAIEAASMAQIDGFITTELAQGYDNAIGERGVRLSGGQRQRLGIARALYRQPRLLVLDEATSALDNATEAKFFEALRGGLKDVAVVSIAHRLSTTKAFDKILVLKAGVVVDQGSFAELVERSEHFQGVST